MKNTLILILSFSMLFLMACQNDGPSANNDSEEIAAIQSVLEDSSDILFDGLDEESESFIDADDPDGMNLSKESAIRTRFVRIRLHPVERSIQVNLDTDTTATAYVHSKIKGILKIKKLEKTDSSFTFDWYDKPITHHVERIVHLKKVNETGNLRRDWRIVDVSMKNGYSENDGVEIVKMVVYPENQDSTVITNPLEYFQNGRTVFTFAQLTKVRVKVTVRNTTANPVYYPQDTRSTETVLLHYGRNPRVARAHFGRTWFKYVGKDGLGNNVYEGSWKVRQFAGMHHAIIDVIDNGTILEKDKDQYPYVSATWASPYRVIRF